MAIGILRIFAIIFAPPLAVLDKGCGAILLVCAVFAIVGWIPASIIACIICLFDKHTEDL